MAIRKPLVNIAGQIQQLPAGDTINAAQNGGAVTVQYNFSTTTTDSDPGNGFLRLSNATQNAATVVRADLLDTAGNDWTTVLDSLDDSTSTVKGHIRLVHQTDYTKFLEFTVSAVASPSGYRNITVANVGSSTSSPFADNDPILLTFTPKGDKGDTGNAGANGQHGGAITIEYLIETAIEEPDSGEIAFDTTDQTALGIIYFHLLDFYGENWESVFLTFTGGTSAIKAEVRIVDVDDPSKWIVAQLSSIPPAPIGENYIPAVVDSVNTSNGASTFADTDHVVATFTKVGDKGDTGAVTNYDLQIFTATGTWTKPSGAVTVYAYLVGGGGGGGSGARDVDGENKSGGGGGGGGGYRTTTFAAGDLSATESVTIGAGGASGASQSTNSSDGNAGSAGGDTTFDSATAGGGGGGGAGQESTSVAVAAGGAGGTGTVAGGAGGAGGLPGTSNAVQGASAGNFNAGAGGGEAVPKMVVLQLYPLVVVILVELVDKEAWNHCLQQTWPM